MFETKFPFIGQVWTSLNVPNLAKYLGPQMDFLVFHN
jgi:hypothetical protein